MAALIHQPTTADFSYNSFNKPVQQESQDFLFFVHELLLKYEMYSKSSNNSVASGGLQQFIIRKSKISEGGGALRNISSRLKALYSKDQQPVLDSSQNGDDICLIQCLPVDLKLHIFSFLDAKSLCMACCVNREWSELTSDELLWKSLLEEDIHHWNQISYLSNPQMYLDVDSDWSNKEIYLQCSPEFKTLAHQSNSAFHHVSAMLKSLLPRKVPKVAMFGPGLEQTTSGLVRNMLYTDNPVFTRVAMFPGQEGIGGGMTLKLPTGHSLHLSVLYTASRNERENRAAGDRLQGNRMIQAQGGQGNNEDEGDNFGLTPQVQQFCQTVDAFIYVIDASQDQECVAHARKELHVMIKERRSSPHLPILILSCVKQSTDKRLPACDIVHLLQVSEFPQPWLVIDCESENLRSVDSGVVWLVNQAQYR